ncbi:prolyl oligopeptidase family protein [Streptomyces odonnellii]|uniref:hypothetical protein n=1 Tax=Streptomyces odonnellii TaxID=1417980 RepID=UPI0018E2BF25|nr:hypothetical protein [Streptomyces odonnellii]
MEYPQTRTTDDVATLAGVTFPDPYQWLQGSSDEVERWQEEQAELAASYVRDWPYFDRLRERVAHFAASRYPAYPRPAGDRWVRTHTPEGTSQAQVLLTGEPYGDGTVLFDSVEEHPRHPPYVSWISLSPDGRILALGVCDDGSERNTIRLIDTTTGDRLPGAPARELLDNWTGGAH